MTCPECGGTVAPDRDGAPVTRCPTCDTLLQAGETGGPIEHPEDELLAAAIDEYERAAARGEAPPLDAFCARHPSVAEPLRKAIAISIQLSRIQQRATPDPGFPEQFGHYRILAQIGRGGMAVVFRARDERLGRDVALKVLLPDPVQGASRRERFLREARALARIDHPNVVPIHDLGEEGPLCYLAMELMDGSLADAAIAGTLPADASARARQAAGWILDAANGIAHVHALGILHRDVKPANLLLGAHGRVRVGDFGLARLDGDERMTLTGQFMGTLRFASPEQSLGEATGAASDVYSLGATLYQLVAGAPPPSPLETDRLPPEPPKGVPRTLAAILARAMSPAAADRYSNAALMAADLRAFLEGRRPAAVRPSRRLRALRWALAASLAAGLAAALAAIVISAQRRVARTRRATTVPLVGLVESASGAGLPGGYVIWKGNRADLDTSEPLHSQLRERNLGWNDLVGSASGAPRLSLSVRGRRYHAELAREAARLYLTWYRSGEDVPAARFAGGADELGSLDDWRLSTAEVDIDGDGLPEMILTRRAELAVIKWEVPAWGEAAPTWQVRVEHQFSYGSPVVEDWDGDGRREVLVGDQGTDLATGRYLGSATFYQVDVDSGRIRRSWPLWGKVYSTPQFLRDARGRIREMYLDVDPHDNRQPSRLFRFTPETGPKLVPLGLAESPAMDPVGLGWPAFQDVDGDGVKEVLVPIFSSSYTSDESLRCIKPDAPASPLWTFHTNGLIRSYPLLVQQDGDAREEVCFGGRRFYCLKTGVGLTDSERIVWQASVNGDMGFVNQPVAIGDLDGDGYSELAAGSGWSIRRMFVFSRHTESHVLWALEPPEDILAAPNTLPYNPSYTSLPFFIARPAALPEPGGRDLLLVGATSTGWVLAWRVSATHAALAWTFRTGHAIFASPQIVTLPSGASAVLVADYAGWLYLLAPGDHSAKVLWSFRARGGIGGTPVVLQEVGRPWAVFTDLQGYIYRVAIVPRDG